MQSDTQFELCICCVRFFVDRFSVLYVWLFRPQAGMGTAIGLIKIDVEPLLSRDAGRA